ncbi:hypothetical protein [Chryseobacterium sp. Leaf394]|uniref:hypothetical protein n=1 Tax=Chryseobacterium sp. Leaf394 TaxID=1736361 RepID=UPI000A83944A|nr:hypothetical protein [Chryseobacterium sp. Leaf394]
MIHHHNGIAISFYDLKALRMEHAGEGGYLIFEFNNAIVYEEDSENGKLMERSYRNEPVSQYYDDVLELQDSFNTWIQVWAEFLLN